MNKLKLFFGLFLGIGLALGSGIVLNGLGQDKFKQVDASTSQTSTLYLKGVINGVDKWHDPTQLWINTENSDKGFITNVTMKAGDIFRFCTQSGWEEDWGWDQLQSDSEAYHFFSDYVTDNNIYVRFGGTFNFYINNSNNIYVTFSESATYSYAVTTRNDTPYIHAFLGSDPLYDWSSDPSVNGQAYDVKLNYSSIDFIGIYRLDDRYLKAFNGFNLKNESGSPSFQTNNITKTVGSVEQVYFINGQALSNTYTKTSDEYKAVEFIYNLVTHRSAAAYDGHNFDYSICATDVSTAETLISTYDGFGSGVRTILNGASLNTYDLSGTYSENAKTYWQIDSIVNALRMIVAKKQGGNQARLLLGSLANNNGAAPIIVSVIAVISLTAIGGYYFLKKGKKEKENTK